MTRPREGPNPLLQTPNEEDSFPHGKLRNVDCTPEEVSNLRNENEATTATCSNPGFARPEDSNDRVTTREVRQLINSLKEIIKKYTRRIHFDSAFPHGFQAVANPKAM
jgi:hypothetical protein